MTLCECIGGPLDGEMLPYKDIVKKRFDGGKYFFQLRLITDLPSDGIIDSQAVTQIMEWIPL